MVNYKDLGLVNSREMFKKAMEGKYAIPAFNFNNMEQMQAIVAACVEQNLLLSYKYPVVPVNMQIKPYYVTWHKVRLNMPKNLDAIFQFVFTSTMATRTNCAYLVSKWDSLLA